MKIGCKRVDVGTVYLCRHDPDTMHDCPHYADIPHDGICKWRIYAGITVDCQCTCPEARREADKLFKEASGEND